MTASRRAARMARRHRRARLTAGLHLVSLMDIFTILVFFLLINSYEPSVLPSVNALRLPESSSEQAPRETVTVTVDGAHILVQGRPVLTVAEALLETGETGSATLPALKAELDHQATRLGGRFTGEVTILGDRNIPYRLLKRLMTSCAQARFDHISLAVLRRETAPKGPT